MNKLCLHRRERREIIRVRKEMVGVGGGGRCAVCVWGGGGGGRGGGRCVQDHKAH